MNTDHREAVDEVRAWLVSLRGGAPFLSSADGWRLVQWLDDGVPVSAIARALERATAARRARRARWPLGLGDASRYLPGVRRAAPERVAGGALADEIRAIDPADPALGALAERLATARGDPDSLLRGALAEIRAFFDGRWAALPPSEREALLDAARAGYGTWLDDLAEGAKTALIEEAARDALRARYPALTADRVWSALHPAGDE